MHLRLIPIRRKLAVSAASGQKAAVFVLPSED